ncbi:F-box protein [Platanthera zijinensis]|uniref:F-box protein n=1 Tax=Platanthera zijinensis TaxID=2320716 RepID=A0AAP0BG57_9ASPA
MLTDSPAITSSSLAAATTTTIEDLHPDVVTRTLRLLDGPTLAAACSATSQLRSLSTQSDLWLKLCLSTWPSLQHPRFLPLISASPRYFFSDAFRFPAFHANNALPVSEEAAALPGTLISAVDIYHRGVLIFSRFVETETSSSWFRGSPFLIDATDQMAEPLLPGVIISPGELMLSWILFDPAQGRAVNVSSRRAVAVERHWYTGETVVRFAGAAVSEGKVICAVVTCSEMTGQVQEVVLTAEDIDDVCVSGEEGLQVVRTVMEAGRNKWRGKAAEEEEAKERYLEYLRGKRRRKESRARREGAMDLCCTAIGVAVFLGFLALVVFR